MSEALSLTVRRFIPAPPESVFRFWTDPELVIQWWGPKGVKCTSVEIDLRVGGRFKIANRLPSGETVWIRGEFLSIDPPSLIRHTWTLAADGPETEVVTVRFQPVEGGTEVEVRHDNVPDAASREGHTSGWVGCLDGLAIFAALP